MSLCPEDLYHYVAASGIVLAGAWAIFTFIRNEKLRKVKELAGVSIQTVVDCISYENNLSLVTITWNLENLGVLPIKINPNKTNMRIRS
ncbi:hypothetical protein WDW89_00395 [Deltaproteobacteria bacterium TL4]